VVCVCVGTRGGGSRAPSQSPTSMLSAAECIWWIGGVPCAEGGGEASWRAPSTSGWCGGGHPGTGGCALVASQVNTPKTSQANGGFVVCIATLRCSRPGGLLIEWGLPEPVMLSLAAFHRLFMPFPAYLQASQARAASLSRDY
jgi:hypothetical protein